MWHGCWYRTGWSDYSADLSGLCTQSFTEEALKRQHAASTSDLWEKRPHWCQRSEETSLNPQHIKLEADVYCSRRPHHALLSAKNRTDCLIQWHPLFWKESDRVSHARPASSSSLPQSEGMLVRLTCDSEVWVWVWMTVCLSGTDWKPILGEQQALHPLKPNKYFSIKNAQFLWCPEEAAVSQSP